jgi:hypothetical protein
VVDEVEIEDFYWPKVQYLSLSIPSIFQQD